MIPGYHKGHPPYLPIALPYSPKEAEPSRPIIRLYWQRTHSVQQVAERCCISLGLAHRLIVAMLQEETH